MRKAPKRAKESAAFVKAKAVVNKFEEDKRRAAELLIGLGIRVVPNGDGKLPGDLHGVCVPTKLIVDLATDPDEGLSIRHLTMETTSLTEVLSWDLLPARGATKAVQLLIDSGARGCEKVCRWW
jgi:hypothetical protein